VLKAVVSRASDFLFKTNISIWFERRLDEPVEEVFALDRVATDFEHPRKTIDWIMQNRDDWHFLNRELAVALENGHYFPRAELEKETVGYMKIGVKRVYVRDFLKCVTFADKTAFVYDTYVEKDMRGKKIARKMITDTLKFLKEKGYARLLCHIEEWNKPSLAVYGKAGFKKLRRIRFLRLMGCDFLSFDPTRL